VTCRSAEVYLAGNAKKHAFIVNFGPQKGSTLYVNVIFYGEIAEVTGKKNIQVNGIDNVHALYTYLEEQYPQLGTHAFKLMVNNELINHERTLEEGDEVLLMEPHVE